MDSPIRVLSVAERSHPDTEPLEREDERISVTTATTSADALDMLADGPFDCVVVGYDLPDGTGLDLLDAVREQDDALPVVLYTAAGSERVASDAISAGVTDYVTRDADDDRASILAARVRNAVSRYRTDRDARRAEERMRELAETTDDVLWMYSADWEELLFVNSAYEEIWGQSVDELERHPGGFLEEVHPADRDRVREVMEELSAGEPCDVEYRVNGAEDYGRWVWVQATPIHEDGEVSRIVGFSRDVTERKAREQAHQETSQRLEAIIEASPDPIVVFDEDATIELWNPAAESVFGYAEAEVLGERFTSLGVVPDDDSEAFEQRLARAFEGETFAGVEVGRRDRAGDPIHLSLSKAPIRAPDGTIQGVVTVKKDISEQKRLEHRLREENERLEEFASVVSHDLRNPLNVADGHLELAREECTSDHLDRVAEAHERMQTLIEDLLVVAQGRARVEAVEPIDFGTVVRGCREFVEGADVTLGADGGFSIQADQSCLEQLLENLFRNAVDHGDDAVTVTVGRLDDGSGFYVDDDGPGVPAADRDRVFEMGYTTTEDGTGFGLAIVERIVDAHGWTVELTESPSGGARFEFTGVEFVD